MDEKRAALRQNAAGNNLRQIQPSRIEDDRPGYWIKDHQQPLARRFHQQGAFNQAHAVCGNASKLGLVPGDSATIDVDGGQRAVC